MSRRGGARLRPALTYVRLALRSRHPYLRIAWRQHRAPPRLGRAPGRKRRAVLDPDWRAQAEEWLGPMRGHSDRDDLLRSGSIYSELDEQPRPAHRGGMATTMSTLTATAAKRPDARRRIALQTDVLLQLVRVELAARDRGSILGWLWSLGPPAFQLAATYFLFTRVFPLDIPNYPVFLLAGILSWTWFARSVGMGRSHSRHTGSSSCGRGSGRSCCRSPQSWSD